MICTNQDFSSFWKTFYVCSFVIVEVQSWIFSVEDGGVSGFQSKISDLFLFNTTILSDHIEYSMRTNGLII